MDPPRMRSYVAQGARLGWMQVTHVCNYWRQMGLHYPHLWTMIEPGLSKVWLPVILARGKSAPLKIRLNNYNIATHGEDICKHVSRTRHIHIFARVTAALVPTLQLMLASPANILQDFLLSNGTDVWLLSEHTFQDHAPMLRSVDLSNVCIPWSAPILCNLTHLQVRLDLHDVDGQSVPNPSFDASAMSPFHRLLDALRRMLALETLHLSYCLPPRSKDPVNSTGTGVVDLPCLKTLELADTTIRCSDLIKCISIPPSCSLNLDCSEDAGPESAMELVTLFRVHLDRVQAPLQSLTLVEDDSNFMFHIPRKDSTNPAYSIELPCPQDPNNSSWDVIATLCRSSRTNSIRRLHFRCRMRNWSPQEWVNALGQCRAVEEVRFSGNPSHAFGFCKALTMYIDGEGGALFLEEAEASFRAAFLEQMGVRQMVRAIQTVYIIQKPWVTWVTEDGGFITQLKRIVPQVEWDERG